jgi:tetratricopeptide (TPR) repeat protein
VHCTYCSKLWTHPWPTKRLKLLKKRYAQDTLDLTRIELLYWKGNAAFKTRDYPNAIGHYTAAILADRKDPTFPLNRAAAYLKLGKYVSHIHNMNSAS